MLKGCISILLTVSACDAPADTDGQQPQQPANVAVASSGVPAVQVGGRDPANGKSLCKSGETALFQCTLPKSAVAVCFGTTSSGENYAQYRHETDGVLDLVYPQDVKQGTETLSWASRGYSGGGEDQLHFTRGGYDYVVYSRTIRTGFGSDGHFDTASEAGVLVKRAGRDVSDRRCSDAPPFKDVDAAASALILPRAEALE